MAQITNKRRRKSIQKRSDNSDNRARAPWPHLPDDLLISILMKLSFVDYFAFCGVCKLWRDAAKAQKAYFMKHQPPLIVVKSTHAKRACLLYDIFGGRKYKAMLPDLTRRSFVGLSRGYLIMLANDFSFCLVNLFTRHELQFPVVPWYVEKFCYKNQLCPILFYSTKLSDFLMVFVDRASDSILLAQSHDAKWFATQNLNNTDSIVDVTIFKGKIYFLTSAARFGELKMHPSPILQLLKTNISIPNVLFSSLQLVTSSKCLFMVSYPHPRLHLDFKDVIIYKLDDTKMDWMKINDLGQKALFLSDMKCSAIVNPTKWGGPTNCVYVSEWMINRMFIYPLDGDGVGETLEDIPIVQEGSDTLLPYFWYIPHKGEKMNDSHEEFEL